MFRRRGWPRAIAVRRIVAVALVLLAAVLALRPGVARGEAAPPVLVASVPVRLADPGLADLLPPGSRVDVIAAETSGHAADHPVLASDAVVVRTHRPAESDVDRGPLVVLALPRDAAARVAAAALHGIVTVTLR